MVGVLGAVSSRLQVDESQLSMSEDCSLPPPPSYPGHSSPRLQMAIPGGGVVSMPLDSSSGVCSSPDPSQASLGPDVLSVSAGEPVTHFNLDQLLEIVQSFQLDTSSGAHNRTTMEERTTTGHRKVCATTHQTLHLTPLCPSGPVLRLFHH